MKKIILVTLALSSLSTASVLAAPTYSCQRYAEKVTLNAFTEDGMSDSDLPQLSETRNVDKNGDDADSETGIYSVEVLVNEECYDGLIVFTKKIIKNGRPACKLVKTKSMGPRECG